jgi:16S rRNA (adenine1518-N6/adenine1519-N6)-dimethyltransferase
MSRLPRPRKRFGQNFLHDQRIIEKLIDQIDPQPEDRLVEIGPGRGALTTHLIERCQNVSAIEIDRDLIAPLHAMAAQQGKEINLIQADILEFDLLRFAEERPDQKLRLVGNLPYNISTPILFHLVSANRIIQDMHFMFQKEVVERMVAPPAHSAYGRLSVMCQYHWKATPLLHIAPGAFYPPPKVDSAFIRLVPHEKPPVETGDPAAFAEVVRLAFGQRRKALRNALSTVLSRAQIEAAGVDPSERAERIDLVGFAALSRELTLLREGKGG